MDSGAGEHCPNDSPEAIRLTDECPLRDVQGSCLTTASARAGFRVDSVKKPILSMGGHMKKGLQFNLREDASWMVQGHRRVKLDV